MGAHKDNVYSFDENTILHSCRVKIPAAFHWLFQKAELKHKNCDKINILVNALTTQGIAHYRFMPSIHLEQHLLETSVELIEQTDVQHPFLPKTFRVEVMDQLKEFCEQLTCWEEIQKAAHFIHIKEFFKQNERPLKKAKGSRYTNIPEDDDCQILAGLIEHPCTGARFLISHDEHFWGYADLIETQYGVVIVKEWECQVLA
ncbi:hypothetical protein HY642_04645 [Candidatus Woesearchaeota archaeon]|nr:hypothetical protein [Candidatus Woesearchaeota archaeon]